MSTYRVFSRRVYCGSKRHGFAPNFAARRTTIQTGLTLDEARALCKQGPANEARDAGREYRHLSFYEFTAES
jgi:hypothetical protein